MSICSIHGIGGIGSQHITGSFVGRLAVVSLTHPFTHRGALGLINLPIPVGVESLVHFTTALLVIFATLFDMFLSSGALRGIELAIAVTIKLSEYFLPMRAAPSAVTNTAGEFATLLRRQRPDNVVEAI